MLLLVYRKLDLQEDMVAELAIGPMVHNRLQTPEGRANQSMGPGTFAYQSKEKGCSSFIQLIDDLMTNAGAYFWITYPFAQNL